MSLVPVNTVAVGIDFGSGATPIGRLALRERRIYFEYERAWLAGAREISPLRLPLRPGVQSFAPELFEGLPGVFNDSLPDGWGRLLFDRAVRAQNLIPDQLSALDRLVQIGARGMGALIYEPDFGPGVSDDPLDLDRLADQAHEVLEGGADAVVAELLALNGSSAGARPKAMVGYERASGRLLHGRVDLPVGFEPWLVKFANTQDGLDAGAIEYIYALMAKDAGVAMTDIALFPAARGAGYFATKRFDREGKARLHVHTASGLLHADHRTPSLDYEDLIALTLRLTRDIREAEKMYRLAVFNVLAHNRDDHAKNFTYLMHPDGAWRFAPAYDLTFSSGPGGEQSTMVKGNGKSPGATDLIRLGADAHLSKAAINAILEQTQTALATWPALAAQYGVSSAITQLIAAKMRAIG